jgi:MYXO-CTERM domain-containing protein
MQWMDFEYQVTTELYYDTTYAMSQPAQNSWQTQYEFGNNGDGSIWYPGKPSVIGGTHDIPVESFRMKMLREGMQDYEYLHLLVTLGDSAFAEAQLATVVTNAGSFTSDPTVLEQARLAMATEIEKDLAAKSDAGMPASSDAGKEAGSAPVEAGPLPVDAGQDASHGSEHDAGHTRDGGTSRSSAARSGSGSTQRHDASSQAAPDAGAGPSSSSSGCSCRVGVAEADPPRVWLGAGFLLLAGFRRRSRAKGASR